MDEALKRVLQETATQIPSGYERRHYMARVVSELLEGSPWEAEKELGWNRKTVSKALREWQEGFCYIDRYRERGRKKAEECIPTLLEDLKEIADSFSQTDPTFRTTRIYTRLTAKEVRHQLRSQKGYSPEKLPSEETIRRKLNQLGYQLKAVQKSKPLKKIPETDAIFEELHRVNKAADADESTLRLSLDAKDTIKIGEFCRNGVSRVVVKALDHDFHSDEKVTPFGIYLPQQGELFLYFTTSKVTSDFIVDCITDFWETNKDRFPTVSTLVLNQDNGPECHSRRTQFMKRITDFVDHFSMHIHLAYYPPYHSKYNPIERVWGTLEQHWNGSLLDSIETVLEFASSLTYKGLSPCVELVSKIYQTGVKLTQAQMARLERRFLRHERLSKWFLHILPPHHLRVIISVD